MSQNEKVFPKTAKILLKIKKIPVVSFLLNNILV